MSAEQTASDYAAKLLPIPIAAEKFGLGSRTFLRLRKRHGIATLPGERVHVDDVINALERERRLKRSTDSREARLQLEKVWRDLAFGRSRE